MKKIYYAVEIHDEIFVMDDKNEIWGLIDRGVSFEVIGRVCAEDCNATCLHYHKSACPCRTMRDIDGNLIHVFC